MAREVEAKCLLCSFLLLSLHICSSFSGTLVIGHDTVAPITIPSTNPSPDIVTVPSTTNPTTNLPTSSPITVPYTNPNTAPITFPTAPITVPATNPLVNPPVTNPTTAPVTVPPVTNPVYTPTNPANQPVTNPITTPANPGTVPISPAMPGGTGQSWCVARSDAPEDALQSALDYACGIGGADCSGIQMSGSCYNPNSLQAHASYAFNSYYQKNPAPTSCDFGGTAMVVTTNPSSGTCTYPSSSSSNLTPVSNPASNPASSSNNPASNPASSSNNPASNPASSSSTGTGSTGIGTGPIGTAPIYGSSSGSGSSVMNTNSSGGSSPIFGSDSPIGTISRSPSCQPGGWILLPVAFAASLLHV